MYLNFFIIKTLYLMKVEDRVITRKVDVLRYK